jgi:hypothetical protein
MLLEQSAYLLMFSEPLEGFVMAHREQHGNREAKKPKKDKGSTKAQAQQMGRQRSGRGPNQSKALST